MICCLVIVMLSVCRLMYEVCNENFSTKGRRISNYRQRIGDLGISYFNFCYALLPNSCVQREGFYYYPIILVNVISYKKRGFQPWNSLSGEDCQIQACTTAQQLFTHILLATVNLGCYKCTFRQLQISCRLKATLQTTLQNKDC